MVGRGFAVVVALFLWTSAADAQCFPECRAGFVCNAAGECVSQCNPACASGEICLPDGRCVPRGVVRQSEPEPQPPQPQPQPPQPQPQPPQPPQPQSQPPQPPPVLPPANLSPPANGVPITDYRQTAPLPPEPRSITRAGSTRLALNAAFGFGGSFGRNYDGIETRTAELEPTLGGSLALQFSLGRYFYLGPRLQLTSYRLVIAGIPDGTRSNVFEFGATLGFRYGIQVGSFSLEPTLGIVLGVAAGIGDEFDTFDSVPVGLAFSVQPGVNFWLSGGFGLHVDMGWQLHLMGTQDRFGDLTIRASQFRLGVGIALRMGG